MKRRKTQFSILGLMAALMVILMLMLPGQRPNYDSIPHDEKTLTLSTLTDFPLMGYASLSFREGGGLFRLYDRTNLSQLEVGQTYHLTIGYPPASRAKGGYRLPGYTAIIAMSSTDGTVITTAQAYQADAGAPVFALVTTIFAAGFIILLGWLGFKLLRVFIRYRFNR